MFDPDLNPYVAQLDNHRDIIKTPPVESNQELLEFIQEKSRLIVDLGCGAGNFLRDYSMEQPNANFLGFELRFKRLVKGAEKLKKRDISNVKLIQARAEDIESWLPDESADEIYVNFPDPWPKKRHRKHRMMTDEFLFKVKKVLRPSGCFVFKTDHFDYFGMVKELVDNSIYFQLVEYTEDLHNSEYNENNIRTEFESLFKGKGFPVYYLKIKHQ